MQFHILLVALLLPVFACAPSPPSARDGSSLAPSQPQSLFPGTYRITLRANAGSHRGAEVVTTLRLRPVPRNSSRPATDVALGHLAGNLEAIGAPLCPEGPSPSDTADSAPGVLLTRDTSGSLLLWVASVANIHHPDQVFTDGCGIVLTVGSLGEHGFSGTWGPAGIVVDGSGSYAAQRTK